MAWDPSGFCKRHRENQSKDLDYAVRILPDKVKKGTESAMIFSFDIYWNDEELRTCGDRSIEDEEEEFVMYVFSRRSAVCVQDFDVFGTSST